MEQIKINKGNSLKEIQGIQMGNKLMQWTTRVRRKKMKKKRELIVYSSYLNQKNSRGACKFVNIGGDD